MHQTTTIHIRAWDSDVVSCISHRTSGIEPREGVYIWVYRDPFEYKEFKTREEAMEYMDARTIEMLSESNAFEKRVLTIRVEKR